MNELIQQLIEKTGLPEDQATTVVNMVTGYLKQKLPAPLAAQIDSVLGEEGGSGFAKVLGGLGETAGGLFGRKE